MRYFSYAVVSIALLVFTGCEPKRVAEVPNLSGEKLPDSADRAIPGGETLAVSLALLDPRIDDPSALGRRRADFIAKLKALIPDPKARAEHGFDELVRWHQLYEKNLDSYQKAVAGLDKQLKGVLEPPKGNRFQVDDRGQATMCKLGTAADGSDTECRRVVGYAQLGHEARELQTSMAAVTEAQWHLLDHMAKLRARLAPGTAR